MYPEVQVVGGGDQRIDQLHAGNLRRRRAEGQKEKGGERGEGWREVSKIKNKEDVSLAKKKKKSINEKAVISLQKNDRPSLKHKCFYFFLYLFVFEGGSII